ncbi:MAG: hypothetical protein ABW000_07560 [Actinoplanes sp.]
MTMINRVFLAAYPARIRRAHGAELVTTLAEMTGDRPSRADRVWLVLDGLRERFQLPGRQPLSVLAVALAVVVGGAVGLAAGSLAGEQTYPSLPAAAPLAEQILGPDARLANLQRERSQLTITGHLGTAAGSATHEQQVKAIHERLAAAGWEVAPIEHARPAGRAAGREDPGVLDQWGFRAQSGELQISVWKYADPSQPVEVLGYPVRPATYLPLVFGGLLVGLVAGWLIGVAMAHRLESSRHRLPAVVVAAVGVAFLVVPTGRLYQGLILSSRSTDGTGLLVHDSLAWMPWPLRDPTVFPDSIAPGVRTLLIGLALAALAAAVAHRARPDGIENPIPS